MKINLGAGKFKLKGWVRIDHHSDSYKHYDQYRDIDMNFLSTQKIELESDSVDTAYCSHVFEHLPEEIVIKIIEDTYRILKPKGIFRITAPDASKGVAAMLTKDWDFFDLYLTEDVFNADEYKKKYHRTIPLRDASIYQIFMYMVMSPKCIHIDVPCEKITDSMVIDYFSGSSINDALDKICSSVAKKIYAKNPWMHISWWDAEKVMRILKKAGFSKVYKSDYGESKSNDMRDTKHFDKVFPHYSFYVEAVK